MGGITAPVLVFFFLHVSNPKEEINKHVPEGHGEKGHGEKVRQPKGLLRDRQLDDEDEEPLAQPEHDGLGGHGPLGDDGEEEGAEGAEDGVDEEAEDGHGVRGARGGEGGEAGLGPVAWKQGMECRLSLESFD